MFDGLQFYQTRPNTIKHIQTRSNSTKQGVQTVKCLVTKQCLTVFGRQTFIVRAWTNDKCLGTKHLQTLFGDQTFYRLDTLFGAVWSCLYVFDRVWSCLIKLKAIKRLSNNLKHFFCSRVWWAIFCSFGQPLIKHVWSWHAYHAHIKHSVTILNHFFCTRVWWAIFCSFGQPRIKHVQLKRACVPCLLSGLYQLFDLCLIKLVLTVWPLTSTLACLVTKQCLMVFGRQTFIVCPGP